MNTSQVDALGIQMLPGYRDPYHGRPLTKGELGCFLSHYNIWKEVGPLLSASGVGTGGRPGGCGD
jgi:GR25 family glycosyltransferase involved in LPS biosynthesis